MQNQKKNSLKSNFRKYKRILLSHHPECDEYKNHTIKIGTLRFCIGCYIGYPTAIIGIVLFHVFKIYLLFNSTTLLLFGIIFFSFFILSPLNLTKIKAVKIIQKFFIGIGSVFLFWWIWTFSSNIFVNLLNFILIFGILIVILNGYHAYNFLKTCKNCEYNANWKVCPGFHTIYNNN